MAYMLRVGKPETEPDPGLKKKVYLKVPSTERKKTFKTGDFEFNGSVKEVPIEQLKKQSPTDFKTGDFEFKSSIKQVPPRRSDNFNTGDFEFKSAISHNPKLRVGNGTPTNFNTGDFEFRSSITNKSNRLPLPDYNNPDSRLNYAKGFTQKYGPLMAQRGDTPLRINEIPDTGTDTSKNLALKTAKGLGLDPALLYSSAMEEGMSGLYPDKNKQVDYSGNEKFPVNGFANFGLDTFSDAYEGLVKRGYLPADFSKNFTKRVQENEKGQKVNSADFKKLITDEINKK